MGKLYLFVVSYFGTINIADPDSGSGAFLPLAPDPGPGGVFSDPGAKPKGSETLKNFLVPVL
jgi:hypothetical protein